MTQADASICFSLQLMRGCICAILGHGGHVMSALLNVIRHLAKPFIDDGWLPLAILGVVVFWMMHSV